MPSIQDSVCHQLASQNHADKAWALALLAALEGDAALMAYLDGTSTIQAPTLSAASGAPAAAAKTRQVIVFTHDDRLPEAVRRLGIPSTVHTVTRRERSAVEVREAMDPVFAYIDDARALAKTTELPSDVTSRVVPGFCRAAIEAACMEKVRLRRLGKGHRHDDVEQLLTGNAKTHPLMALALFDDETRTGEVLSRLNKMGAWAADVFKACKEGAHEQFTGDFGGLIDDAKRLAAQVRTLP